MGHYAVDQLKNAGLNSGADLIFFSFTIIERNQDRVNISKGHPGSQRTYFFQAEGR